MIQWVHRSTRGWSYGSSVVDPRTGEIIKGHVSLGSLRVRQDFLIAQGLMNQFDDGTEPMINLALARLRQLSAHEVGHTIGLVHNYASSFNQRASVMDYPHPFIQIDDEGEIDLSNAYDTNIGEWDKVAINYGYAEFDSDAEENKRLTEILEKAIEGGLLHITDRDARAVSGAHPVAHLWDNGENAADELNRMMTIRAKVLNELSEDALPTGEPYSSLEEILVPMYLFHRYQVEATVKLVGGLAYNYAVKGDSQYQTRWLSKEIQIDALDALINTIRPESLKLNPSLIQKIPPKAHGYSRGRESFDSQTGPVWDYYSAIRTAAEVPMGLLFHPERANRLVMFNDLNPDQPGLKSVLERLISETWKSPASNESDRSVQRIVESLILKQLVELHGHKSAMTETKAISYGAILDIKNISETRRKQSTSEDKIHYDYTIYFIDLWLKEPDEVSFPDPIRVPDGSPIGSMDTMCGFDY
jgi:hypothetical protein